MYPITCDIPLTKRSIITYGLCILIVVIHLFQYVNISGPPRAMFGFISSLTYNSPWYTFFTHCFFHSNLFHLFSNLLFMIVFVARVEEKTTRVFFVTLLLTSCIFGGMAMMVTEPQSMQPLTGISGIVSGALGVFVILFRYVRVGVILNISYLWVPLYIPSVVIIVLWLCSQVFLATTSESTAIIPHTRVAWESHTTAFFIGMGLTLLFNQFGKLLR